MSADVALSASEMWILLSSGRALSPRAGKSGENCDCCVLSGNDVGEGNPGSHRVALLFPGNRHPSTLGLNDEIVAELGDWTAPNPLMVHQMRRGCASRRAPGSIPRRSSVPGLKLSTMTSAFRDETLKNSQIGGRIEVEGDAPLVAIDGEEIGALAAVIERRTPPASVVPSVLVALL